VRESTQFEPGWVCHSLCDTSRLTNDRGTWSSEVGTPLAHAGNAFISVVHRLAASKSTSARIATCSLGPVLCLWSHLDLDFPRPRQLQLRLRAVISLWHCHCMTMTSRVEVIVRKSTAAVLHEIAELLLLSLCLIVAPFLGWWWCANVGLILGDPYGYPCQQVVSLRIFILWTSWA